MVERGDEGDNEDDNAVMACGRGCQEDYQAQWTGSRRQRSSSAPGWMDVVKRCMQARRPNVALLTRRGVPGVQYREQPAAVDSASRLILVELAGYSTVYECVMGAGWPLLPAGMAGMGKGCPISGSSCVARQKSPGSLWATWAASAANEMDSMSSAGGFRAQGPRVKVLSPQPSVLQHTTLVGYRGALAHQQRFHVEHSPQSRWIVGAASLSECTPKCSPRVRPAIKKDIG